MCITLVHLKSRFLAHLKQEYPERELESFFYILTEFFLGLRRIDMALNPNFELSPQQEKQFEAAMEQLEKQVPIQYITGETEFYGLPLKVSPAVLIPRPETEELVEWIISDSKESNKKIKILDIGTGSGCIPISLKKNLSNAEINALDISEEALQVARENAKLNGVEIDFKKVDILTLESLSEKYDIIVSNPPYVREEEQKDMKPNVVDHEPKQALYVEDENPLLFYKKITKLAENGLLDKGFLYFEINQYLGQKTKKMVESHGFKTELKKDIFNNDRMLKAWRD